jgi:cell division septation protein DedD
MAAHDYHENSFIFKTITVFRIIIGVAVTLAVLFAMVWLIDYSSPRTAVSHNQQPLLVPDRADETAERTPRTFFETLLNTASEKNASDAVRDGTPPEPALAAGMPKPPVSVDRKQTPAALRGAESAPVAIRPEPPVSPPRAEIPPAASSPVQTPAVIPHTAQAPASGEVFSVQFGSFQQEERARQLSEDLAARGYHPFIATISMPDGTQSHRVRVGRFATREEAMKLAASIERTEKVSVFVTSK